MKEKVSVVKRMETVQETVRQALNYLGGMEAYVKPGQSVLLKPNCTGPLSSEDGAATSLEVLESVILLAKRREPARLTLWKVPERFIWAHPKFLIYWGLRNWQKNMA